MRANILTTALFASLTLTAITSVRAEEATFEVTWLGKNDKSWTDSGVWDSATPEAWQTAIITNSSLIKFKAETGKTVVSNIVVGANVSPTFQRANTAPTGYGQHLLVQEMNGAGTLKLNRVGIHADYSNYDTCNISVAKIEAVANGSNDSWFDGGTASGKRMVVNSDITINGFLKVYKQTTLAGETTLAGNLLMVDEAVVVNNLVYAGDDATIDSASKGSVERLTVRSGTLSPSTLPTGVTVGSLVLDGGTLSVASDFSGTIAVAEGGGTLFLEGKWNDDASVSLPAGLSFAEGADLSKVTVQATIGESTNPAIFAIVNDNEAYSLEYVGYPFHLEELDLSWMTSGWEHPVTNKSIYSISDGSYTSLRLWNGSDWQSYSKGISVQAESHLIIKLGGNGFAFSAVVGLDRSADGDGRCGSKVVKFAVRDVVGGTNLVESAWLGTKTAAQTLTADLSGVDRIELVVYPDPDNGGGWQHCDWVNPTIVMKGAAAPATKGPNHWVGRGTDTNWDTAANWEFGVPREDATAVFDASANVILDSSKTISNIVVNAGATVRFRTGRLYDVWPSLIIQETGGDGTMQFSVAGLQANHVNSSTVYINTANIEFQSAESDDWFTAGSAEGQKLVVNSRVKVQGFMRAYSGVHFVGDLVLDGGSIYLSDKAVVEKLVLDSALKFGKSNDNPPVDSTGKINEIVVHGTTYNYSDFADKTWPLTVDGGSVDIGDGSSIGSSGLELGVLSGGYLRYTVSEIPEIGVPDFPQNLTFAADADLSNVFAIVKNSSGDAQKTYTITKAGDVYSFAEVVPTDTVKWIGGVDNRWETAGNWIYGAVPTEGQPVLFERNAHIYIEKGTTVAAVSTMTIADGAKVRIETTEEWGWDNGPVLPFAKITGGGVLQLKHAQLRGAPAEGESAVIECGGIEILSHANNDSGRSSILDGPVDGAPMIVTADISGVGYLKAWNRIAFGGDNSGFKGEIHCDGSNGYGNADRYFDTPGSFFPNARLFYFRGRIFINFADGTAPMGNVDVGESWGASLVMKDGANVTLEVASGKINDSHNGDGFEVWTRAEGADDYLRVTGLDTGSGYTKGCAGLTIKKVGDGTLVYGLTKAHNLVVAEGRVEFTGENNNGDDADVNVTVKAGASIGTPEAFSHENPNWTLGGDVTVRHQFTFEPGGAIKQEYIATPVMVEQVDPVYENEVFVSNIVSLVESGDYTYSMRKLTIADDVDLANVVFGVTNPEDLPAVTKASLADLPRFTMFAANALSGAVATENGGYAPEGSEKNGAWIARPSRTVANAVEFRPYIRSGLAVIIR